MATGSLVPDSISSVERTRSRSVMPPTRSRKNTAAASVGATIAPSRKASGQARPKRSRAATPDQDRGDDDANGRQHDGRHAAMRSVAKRVSKPESKRMIGERDRADEEGRRPIVEGDPADPVLAGEKPEDEEDQEERRAEAEADEAGEDRGDDQRRSDENDDRHRFEHERALVLLPADGRVRRSPPQCHAPARGSMHHMGGSASPPTICLVPRSAWLVGGDADPRASVSPRCQRSESLCDVKVTSHVAEGNCVAAAGVFRRDGVESNRRRTGSLQDDELVSAECGGEPAMVRRSLDLQRVRPDALK